MSSKKRKNSIKKRAFKLLILFIAIIFILFNFSFKKEKTNNYIASDPAPVQESESEPKIEETTTSMNMCIIGDIMCHNTQITDAKKLDGSYDFSKSFENIKNYTLNADLSIGNLETTFYGNKKAYSGYPMFNTPEALAQNLKDIGIDILTTSNNHSLDTGYQGLVSTINYLDSVGISHTGTFSSAESQNDILFKEVNDIKFAFLSYTYGTNGIPVPSGKEYCINLIDKDLILSHLELAKQENPDVICVSMHWGQEYQTTPNSTQDELAEFLFENGVDIILGSHPHVLQPMEKRTVIMPGGTQKDGFIIYSLGNFISGQTKANTKDSIILNLTVTKTSNSTNNLSSITLDNINYIPIYTYSSSGKNYKVLDIKNEIEKYETKGENCVSESVYNTLFSELNNINKILLPDNI